MQVVQRTFTESVKFRVTCLVQDVMGKTPDISECLDFGFYDHVSYKDNSGLGMTAIRRWLGVSHRVVGLVSYCIITQKGTVISTTTVQHINIL